MSNDVEKNLLPDQTSDSCWKPEYFIKLGVSSDHGLKRSVCSQHNAKHLHVYARFWNKCLICEIRIQRQNENEKNEKNTSDIRDYLRLVFYLEFANRSVNEYNEVYLRDFHIHKNRTLEKKKKV